MKILIAIIYFEILINAVIATDYCSKDICNKGYTHIACNNTGKFYPNCPYDAELREITEPLKKFIVKVHNEKRNTIAEGGDNFISPACRMATLEWDDELASLAKLNVLQCLMKPDICHNTDAFRYSGQCLNAIGFYGNVNDTENIQKSIEFWFQEKNHIEQKIIEKFPQNYTGPDIGNLTVIVVDRNVRVGCAAATYSTAHKGLKKYLFVCNYAATNMIGFPIYKSCDDPAIDCTTGTNPSYKNLCSISESYDVNKYY